mmetsp:Transcript_2139/g.5830  ORF Transcript_2139/g.5830 Transcript_2139/m.5830 type:complete len:224 (+) Transcript_2139:536-1207(+)
MLPTYSLGNKFNAEPKTRAYYIAPLACSATSDSSCLSVLDDRVESSGWSHDLLGLVVVWLVVATNVRRRTLDGEQLLDDLVLVLPESGGHVSEGVGKISVNSVGSKLLGPEESEVVVASSVVDATEAASWALVLVKELSDRGIEGSGQQGCPAVAGGLGNVLESRNEGHELTKGVPPQIVLLDELLDVLWSGPTGASLEKAATVHQRHDAKHLRGGSNLKDWE